MANTPNIRFKGFTDDWEQHELCDIYGKIRNAFVGTASPYYVENGHFYLESNNVKDGHINHNNEVFINDEFYEKQRDNWLHTGDIVMVQSGHVGHSAVIPEELNNTAAHALIIISNPQTEIDPYFLNAEFQTPLKKKNIDIITKGNTIKHILASDMKEFEVSLPNIREQRDISAFFRILDKILIIHQRRLEDLKNFKKVMLQKMFPSDGESIPEIRFFGFSDAWEQRKLGDVIEQCLEKNTDMIYGINDAIGVTLTKEMIPTYANMDESTDVSNFYLVNPKCFVYNPRTHGKKIGLGLNTSNHTYIVTFNDTVFKIKDYQADENFLHIYLSREEWDKEACAISLGTSTIVLKWNVLCGMTFIAPSVEEQRKISELIVNLDNLITLHQHKYENLLKMKKYLLQQMFC